MFVVALTLTNSSLSGDVAAGGPARAARLQLGQERLLHRLLQCDALQIRIFYRDIKIFASHFKYCGTFTE